MNDVTPVAVQNTKPSSPKSPLLTDMRFIILDTETTGPDVKVDHVIQVCCRGWMLHAKKRFNSEVTKYVDPGVKVPPDAMAVHHITNEKLDGNPRLDELLPEFLAIIGNMPILAYNSEFDRKILTRALPYYSEESKVLAQKIHDMEWLDVKRIVMKTWHIGQKNADGFPLNNYQLQNLRYWAKLPKIEGEAHSASADTEITGFLFKVAVKELIKRGEITPDISFSDFKKYYEEPIKYVTVPLGSQKGLRPEEIPHDQLKRMFEPHDKFYSVYKETGILDWLTPTYHRAALDNFGVDRPIPMPKQRSRIGTG